MSQETLKQVQEECKEMLNIAILNFSQLQNLSKNGDTVQYPNIFAQNQQLQGKLQEFIFWMEKIIKQCKNYENVGVTKPDKIQEIDVQFQSYKINFSMLKADAQSIIQFVKKKQQISAINKSPQKTKDFQTLNAANDFHDTVKLQINKPQFENVQSSNNSSRMIPNQITTEQNHHSKLDSFNNKNEITFQNKSPVSSSINQNLIKVFQEQQNQAFVLQKFLNNFDHKFLEIKNVQLLEKMSRDQFQKEQKISKISQQQAQQQEVIDALMRQNDQLNQNFDYHIQQINDEQTNNQFLLEQIDLLKKTEQKLIEKYELQLKSESFEFSEKIKVFEEALNERIVENQQQEQKIHSLEAQLTNYQTDQTKIEMQKQIKKLKSGLQFAQKTLQSWEEKNKEHDALLQQIDEANQIIELQQQEINKLSQNQNQFNDFSNKIMQKDKQIIELTNQLNTVQKDLQEICNHNEINTQFNSEMCEKYENKLAQAKLLNEKLQEEKQIIEEYLSSANDKLIQQTILNENKKGDNNQIFLNKIQEKDRKIEQLIQELQIKNEGEEKNDSYQKIIQQKDQVIQQLKNEVALEKQRTSSLVDTNQKLNSQLENYQQKFSQKNDNSELLKNQLEQKNSEIQTLKQQIQQEQQRNSKLSEINKKLGSDNQHRQMPSIPNEFQQQSNILNNDLQNQSSPQIIQSKKTNKIDNSRSQLQYQNLKPIDQNFLVSIENSPQKDINEIQTKISTSERIQKMRNSNDMQQKQLKELQREQQIKNLRKNFDQFIKS